MTIPTFIPARRPIIGESVAVTARTISPSFGDGYSQTTIDGLNALSRKATLRWQGLSIAQKDNIQDQFEVFSGTSFAYQLPIENVVRIWRCISWTVNDTDGVVFTIDATFDQAFDIDDIGGGVTGTFTFDSETVTFDDGVITMDSP